MLPTSQCNISFLYSESHPVPGNQVCSQISIQNTNVVDYSEIAVSDVVISVDHKWLTPWQTKNCDSKRGQRQSRMQEKIKMQPTVITFILLNKHAMC